MKCWSVLLMPRHSQHSSSATWLIHTTPTQMCDKTHSYMRHDSFIYVTWPIHTSDMSHSCVPWLIHTCDMTHSYVCHDSFMCVPCLIHVCAMTHSYVWHDSFICVPWLICGIVLQCNADATAPTNLVLCDVTHSYFDVTHSYFDVTHSYFDMTHVLQWVVVRCSEL